MFYEEKKNHCSSLDSTEIKHRRTTVHENIFYKVFLHDKNWRNCNDFTISKLIFKWVYVLWFCTRSWKQFESDLTETYYSWLNFGLVASFVDFTWLIITLEYQTKHFNTIIKTNKKYHQNMIFRLWRQVSVFQNTRRKLKHSPKKCLLMPMHKSHTHVVVESKAERVLSRKLQSTVIYQISKNTICLVIFVFVIMAFWWKNVSCWKLILFPWCVDPIQPNTSRPGLIMPLFDRLFLKQLKRYSLYTLSLLENLLRIVLTSYV